MSHKPTITDSLEFPSESRLPQISFGIGAAGLLTSAIGYFVNADQFFFSYIVSFTFFTGIALASLILIMIHHITKSSWGTVMRRIPEVFASNLWIWSIFFIPIFFGIHNLFHWSHPELMDPASTQFDTILGGKAGYLNVTFFVIRQFIYFIIWGVLGRKLYKTSIELDNSGDWGLTVLMRKISAPGILLFSLSVAFASFDWMMSLDPHWFSTMFGVYFFSIIFQALFPVLIIIILMLHRRGLLTNTIRSVHIYDLGAWFFAFTIFYAYIAFSQFMLIYYANIPEETLWFYNRLDGGYQYILYGTLILRFMLPFFLLLNRESKKNTNLLLISSIVVLFIHYFEIYLIAMPALSKELNLSWIDLATFLGLGGVFFGLFFNKFKKESMVPKNDPTMEECLSKSYHQ
ncbi:MAG: hypothetical protein WC967_02435 [Balneolaceae bacterium]